MKTLLTGIVSQTREEDKASPIFAHLFKSIEHLKDPNDFHVMAIYPIERVIGTFVDANFKKDNYLAREIYLNYHFFESNISQLCTQFYGSGCSVDRGRYLIRAAIKWQETGKMPMFNWKQEYTFHYPETGTPRQWMFFVSGLQRLLYGYNQEYIHALKVLIVENEKSKKKSGKNSPGSEEGKNDVK
jgi:hypothetical protein